MHKHIVNAEWRVKQRNNKKERSAADGEHEISKHSPYLSDEELKKNNKQSTFIVLSLNCQNLNAKIYPINIKLEKLRYPGCELSAICLQEIMVIQWRQHFFVANWWLYINLSRLKM